MYRRILVPLDGSDEARVALPVAVELAQRFGASLLLLQMVPTGDATIGLAADVASGALGDPGVCNAEVEAREQIAQGYVSAVADELAATGIEVSYAVGTGGESRGIVEAAQREGVDLIVMATHARSGLGRLVFGSVTDAVLRGARVPVLAIPPHRDSGED